MKMNIYGLSVFFCGLSAAQGLVNVQLALIFKFDRVNDVNDICRTDSIWYNKSTAESNVKRFLEAILSNSTTNVSVENVAYQTEPGYWDSTCANTSVTNVTNVAVLKVNLTTSQSSGKEDVKMILNNFWHGGWDYSVLSSIIGNKSHWIACVQADGVESATKEYGRLHPLDCENITRDTSTSTYNPSFNTTPSIIQNNLSTTTDVHSTQSTGTSGSSTQDIPSETSSTTTGYTSWKQISSSADQSLESSGSTGYKSSSTVYYSSQSQGRLGGSGYSSLKSGQQKKDDPSNALSVGLGTGLGILALLGILVTLLYRYFSEKNKVSDFTGIYGFPPETPRQSDRAGKSTFRQNMA